VLAEAELVLSNVPEGVLNIAEADQLGWQVYPEETGS
jgi:hypothetical protein